MEILRDWIDQIRAFLEMGGPVLWGILFISTLLWGLIIERYWFIWFTHREGMRNRISDWQERRDKNSWYANQIRDGIISEADAELRQSLLLIKTMTAVLPLLGLLGTVTGMIETFEVMTLFGKGYVRGMAGGISEALVTTMAGLVTALSGLYFSVDLRRRVSFETEKVAERLQKQ